LDWTSRSNEGQSKFVEQYQRRHQFGTFEEEQDKNWETDLKLTRPLNQRNLIVRRN
jgi:hypothetical protein